jgi:hypothetical protein
VGDKPYTYTRTYSNTAGYCIEIENLCKNQNLLTSYFKRRIKA